MRGSLPAIATGGRETGGGLRVRFGSVWSEFCRVALTDKCRAVERELRLRDPDECDRIFGKRALPVALPGGGA
jgi:hypothetical protein